ncbi:MAG: putative LPS assembly protein LptD [Fidelibacterota bacterium]
MKLYQNIRWGCAFFVAMVLFISQLSAQSNRLRLKQADLLENKTINGQSVQILTGNVVFLKGDMTITCDTSHYQEKTGQGLLSGHVIMNEGDQNLTADFVHYDSPNDIFTCYNNVHIWDNDYDLIADTAIYYSALDSGIANGHARMDQQRQLITADILRYVKHKGDKAVSYRAENHVRIVEGERVATCGTAIYDVHNDRTLLQLNPKLEEKTRILEGSEIQLFYKEEVLDYVFIPSKAHVVNTSKGFRETNVNIQDSTIINRAIISYKDDMTGKILKGIFKDGRLDSVRLEGMATTLYHIFEDSVYQGNNLASGDTITMSFQNTDSVEVELNRIYVSGGSRGVFTPDSSNQDMDAPITYSSDEIIYDILSTNTDLTGEANIQYNDINLSSGFINVDWTNNLLSAFPTFPGDTLSSVDKPSLLEKGRDPMVGDTLLYNLKSRKGRVKQGRSQADDGYYTGKEIRNRDKKVYYIENSSYTTCDLETPHFHFESRKMKIINDDKVIARPIVLYVSQIPIIGLPFGIFPHKSGGRHSGWIMPGYGENRVRGQYFNNLGYFWAPNEYWGSKFTMSFGDRQGFIFHLDNAYNVRYKFDGSLNLQSRQILSGTDNITDIGLDRTTSYQVQWRHTQKLRHNQNLRVNAHYSSSGEFNRKYTSDPQQRMGLQQTISNATYSKSWPSIKASMSMNLSAKTNLMADDRIDSNSVFYMKPTRAGMETNITTATFPSMSFRLGQRNLFQDKGSKQRWYNNISWSYNTSLTNNERIYYETEETIVNDTTTQYFWNDERLNFNDNVMHHSMSWNAPTKILKYITFNPNLSLKSDWVNHTFDGSLDSSTNKIQTKEIPGFSMRTTGSFGTSINTQIYGLFPINIGKIIAVRHVVSPSVGYSFTPDFSKKVFGQNLGYYETILDTSGQKIFHDRFGGTLAGGTSRRESQSMTFGVNNNFQAKVNDGEKDKIINLFSWRTGTSYNFVADQFKLKPLSSSIRSKIGSSSIDLRMTHDFYEYDNIHKQRINKYRTSEKGYILPRLTKVDLSTGFKLTGRRFGASQDADTTRTNELIDSLNVPSLSRENVNKNPGGILWTTNFSIGYSLKKFDPRNPIKTFWLNTNSTFNVTKNWKLSYSARFDLIDYELISHQVTIHRDLHCWELNLSWTPSGYASGFYLRINVKSPTLRDIKVEKTGGIRRIMPY